jgi:hypothetical protein
MSTHRFLTAAAAVPLLSACVHQDPVVQVSTQDATLNTRWHANLASPASLAGAVQMNGSASMAPSADSVSTDITLDLANAAPGGLHPWAMHRGQCGTGTDYGVYGSRDAYPTLNVGSDGRASAVAAVQLRAPGSGNYFVVVHASAANAETIVACGNLAPPTR